MPTGALSGAVRHLLADLGPEGGGATDGELLARFLRSRDGDALAALVRRHAAMVWGVCRRLLSHHDAEDAFQATFLVLVRRAADVPGQAVANWLYGVARQTAVRVRATAAKRARRETQVANMPEPTVAEARDTDLQSVLDEELGRLPDHSRSVIVLCDLEGMTRKEAARQLGIPEGSVASRLARARVMLAERLRRRGFVFSGGSVAAVLPAASASAPPALVASTIKAVSLAAAGQAAGVVTAEVTALTDGVVKAMFVTKIKSVLAVVLVAGLALGGIGLGVGLSTNPAARAETPMEAPVEKESPAQPVATKKDEKPPHIVEKTDMKGRMPSGLPCQATEDGSVVVKSFFAKMPTYPDIRFREFFDPRYLKKHGLTDRDIAFEIANHQGIDSLRVADDNLTVLVVLDVKGGGKEAFVVRCVVHEGRIYISPEKAPDPKTGIFTPWILRASPANAAGLINRARAAEEKQPAKTDQERMVGGWVIVNDDSRRKGENWIIGTDEITMNANLAGFRVVRHFHRLDPAKSPKQIDIRVTKTNLEPVGLIKGIYALDNDGELRLCLGEMGEDRPAAFPEKPTPGEVLILRGPPGAKADGVGKGKDKLQVLIDKVLEAHGGEEKLGKLQFTMTVKHSNGETQHYSVQPPKNFRWETTHPDRTGKRIVILFTEGRRWWSKEPNEEAREFHPTGIEPKVEYWHDNVKFFGPRQVLRLKDADHKVALLDEEAKVGDRAAVGVEVTGPHFKGKMYFDRETHLLVKRTADSYYRSQGFIVYSDYKTFDGVLVARKETDGYYDPEVTDFKVVEKPDAKLFEQP